MERWLTDTRLPLLVDALCLGEDDPAVRRLIEALGGDPVETAERRVGEPARLARRLRFASGGELIVQDGVVAAARLHAAGLDAGAADLAAWTGARGDTLDDLRAALGARRRFGGIGTPYFELGGAFARCDYRDRRGWNEPGNLLALSVLAERPGHAPRPEDDFCDVCGDLVERDAEGTMRVESTVARLTRARAEERLEEDAQWVRLDDLLPLHASGLMKRVECQLTCTACRRIVCVTLHRSGAPRLVHRAMGQARRRPLEAIPPVEQWGDAARIAREQEAMRYVDHRPGGWFLVERQGALFLMARYVISSMADDSALIRLDDAEVAAYRAGGHDYLCELGSRVHDNGPHREGSPFRERDLFRGPQARTLRAEVDAAIVNHTWLAQQRRG